MNRARYREACELIRAMVAEQLARPAATLRSFSEQALTDAHTIGLDMDIETRLVCGEPATCGSSRSLDTWLEQRIGVLLNYVFSCMPAESRTRANVERQARDVFLMTTPPQVPAPPAPAPTSSASGVRVSFQMCGKGLCLVRQTTIGPYVADTVVLAGISELNEKALRAYKLVGGTIDDTILGEP